MRYCRQAVAESHDIEVGTPERASWNSHYHGFLYFGSVKLMIVPFYNRHDFLKSIYLEIMSVFCYYLYVRIFKNTWFTRFADKEGILDGELIEMANQLEAGQADADLGGSVYKMRIARSGEGKSGGYRVIVFFRSEERVFYVYGFAKSERSNLDQKETREYKALAKKYLNLSDKVIEIAIQSGKFIEV